MDYLSIFSSDVYTWVILPLLIFIARVCDVSLGTIRIIFISRGMKYLAPVVGFFEIIIWLLALGQIMQDLTNIVIVAYAGGFAMGTFVGIYIEEKLAMGVLLVRIITKKDASELIDFLESAGYGVTSVAAQSNVEQAHIIYITIKRGDLQNVVEIIRRFNPTAFYTIVDIKSVSEEVFPLKKPRYERNYLSSLISRRKGK
ncbi:MAG: DUF2179 domain-containing protein [Methanosarcinales archaeon Met12]|nr:MAG: DUF2179 domain-containing protein [Methanosarcinales archaeon Met12]